jgi:pyruvate dehydrogenase E2 component (dihydrolipoamide acetyltransferase)
MAHLLRMPEVSANATEAVLGEWSFAESQPFAADDSLAVIETDKAAVEIEAEADGVVLKLLVTPGSSVEVGAPIAVLGEPGEVVDDMDAILAELGVEERTPSRPAERRDVPETPAAGRSAAGDGRGSPAEAGVPVVSEPARIFSSPLARRLVRDAGLQLADLTGRGSGPGGRIVRRDVEAAIEAAVEAVEPGERASASAPPPLTSANGVAHPAAAPGYVEEPHSRIRRVVAERLTQSKNTIPHFYLKAVCEVDALLALRAEANTGGAVKISVNDLVIKAVAVAHRAVPEVNVVFTESAMRRYEHVDVAVAIASERGLVTPVLRGVDRLPLSAIASTVREFVTNADQGRLAPSDLEGATITVTNLGMFGTEEFSAIINPPQSAILAVGAARPGVVVRDGAPAVATTMALTLSVDHRAIDGALAARWMAALVSLIEHPLQILI